MRATKPATVSIAVVAALTATLLPVSFHSAGASTTACGNFCTSPYNESVGSSEVLTVTGTSSVGLAAASTSSTQDWTVMIDSTSVDNAEGAQIISPKWTLLYGTDAVVEFQYAPNGTTSGNCLSIGTTSTQETIYGGPTYTWVVPSQSLTLAPCGFSALSLWIVDDAGTASGYVDLINAGYANTDAFIGAETGPSSSGGFGSPPSGGNLGPPSGSALSTPFAEPYALTVSSGNLTLSHLTLVDGDVSGTQEWADTLTPAEAGSQVAKKLGLSSLRSGPDLWRR
jgi:hypothetical protein